VRYRLVVAGTPARPQQAALTPALRNLIETVVPTGSRCLTVGQQAPILDLLLGRHGCSHVAVSESQLSALPFGTAPFDAVLLLGVLDRLTAPCQAARQLRRILRPGGVLLVSAANDRYWRRRLGRVLPGEGRASGSHSPGSLRRLLLEAGFAMVGVEGQDGALVRELPFAGRFSRGRSSAAYRLAERLFPSLLGSQVGAFAIRL
jgi:SAM-dependent methyltransferase